MSSEVKRYAQYLVCRERCCFLKCFVYGDIYHSFHLKGTYVINKFYVVYFYTCPEFTLLRS